MTIRNDTVMNDDWMKTLPGYKKEKARIKAQRDKHVEEGGSGSGNFGHEGVPGEQGGSKGTGKVEPFEGRLFINGRSPEATIEDLTPKQQEKYLRDGVKMRQEVGQALSRHDTEAVTTLRGVSVYTNQFAWNRACEDNDLDGESTAAFYDPANRMIYVPRFGGTNLNTGELRSTFDHEMGHVVWENRPFASEGWRRAYSKSGFDRHTAYSYNGGAEEAFAETYAAWIARGRQGNWKSFAVVESVVQGININQELPDWLKGS